MGPLFSMVTAGLWLLGAVALGSTWLIASGGIIALINLSNLLPIPFADGGIIVDHLSFCIGKLVGTSFILAQIIAAELAFLMFGGWWIGAFAVALIIIQIHLLIPWWGNSQRASWERSWRSQTKPKGWGMVAFVSAYVLTIVGLAAIVALVFSQPEMVTAAVSWLD